MKTITLLTDFGLKDGNVGVMKGVILGIAPEVQLVDISHQISPQNIAEAALILYRSAPYFPGGTVHVIVVDPGVGTVRRPIAGRIGDQFYVAPDNGVLTMVLERAENLGLLIELYHLDKTGYWLHEISDVFHGRDIFAPVGAHLANAVSLQNLGTRIHDMIRLRISQPEGIPRGLRGEIIHIDHFGNFSSNIRKEHLSDFRSVTVIFKDTVLDGLVKTFGERKPGELVALFGSTGNLIISAVNGDAASILNAKIGDPIEVITRDV